MLRLSRIKKSISTGQLILAICLLGLPTFAIAKPLTFDVKSTYANDSYSNYRKDVQFRVVLTSQSKDRIKTALENIQFNKKALTPEKQFVTALDTRTYCRTDKKECYIYVDAVAEMNKSQVKNFEFLNEEALRKTSFALISVNVTFKITITDDFTTKRSVKISDAKLKVGSDEKYLNLSATSSDAFTLANAMQMLIEKSEK